MAAMGNRAEPNRTLHILLALAAAEFCINGIVMISLLASRDGLSTPPAADQDRITASLKMVDQLYVLASYVTYAAIALAPRPAIRTMTLGKTLSLFVAALTVMGSFVAVTSILGNRYSSLLLATFENQIPLITIALVAILLRRGIEKT